MGAAWYWARSDLRRRRRAALGLALLVAVATVVPVTAAAAARRTSSSVERMREELRPHDAQLLFEDLQSGPPADVVGRASSVEGVERIVEGAAILARPVGDTTSFLESFGYAPVGAGLGTEMHRPRVRTGRMPTAADEVLLSPRLAGRLGLDVGDTVILETMKEESLQAALEGTVAGYDGPRIPLRVVGIGELPEELTGGPDTPIPAFAIGIGFVEQWPQVGLFSGAFLVHLEDGPAGVDAFEQAARAEFSDRRDLVVDAATELVRVGDGVRVQTLGLLALTLVAGLAAVLACSQAVTRHVRGISAEQDALAAVGMGARARTLAAVLSGLTPVGLGVVLGLAGAFGASRWFPTGAAGRIEPDPGLDLDVFVFLVAPAVALAVGAAAAVIGLLGRRVRRQAARTDVLAGSGMPPVLATGVAGVIGRNGRAASSGSAVAASVAGVAGIVGALVFAANLTRTLDSPESYGWPFDYQVTLGEYLGDDDAIAAARVTADVPGVATATYVRAAPSNVSGRTTILYGFRPVKGDPELTVVDGRLPTGEDEVALGATVLRAVGKEVGETVEVDGKGGRPRELAIVGRILVPTETTDDPADAAVVSGEALAHVRTLGPGFPTLYVSLVEGGDRAAAVSALEERGYVIGAVPPPVVTNLRGVDDVPVALAAFLALLAVAATAHALLTAIRRRRAELAVLKTLGFRRRQVAGTVFVQALVFAAVGLALGVPLGLGLGRQAWRALAGSIGFADDVTLPVPALLLLGPAAVAIVLLLAAWPARTAARIRPAVALRSE